MKGKAAPFHQRPSAQPFIPSRRKPSPQGVAASLGARPTAVSLPLACAPLKVEDVTAATVFAKAGVMPCEDWPAKGAEADSTKDPMAGFTHLPSVGTWMLRPSTSSVSTGQAQTMLAAQLLSTPLALEGRTLPSQADDDGILQGLITQASQKYAPATLASMLPSSFDKTNVYLQDNATLRFKPSVGTWLQPRLLPAAASSAVLTLTDSQVPQAALPQVARPLRLSAGPQEPETDGFELHFFHLDFAKVNVDSFKSELIAGLLGIGCAKDLISSIKINLRAGSVIAEIRGPASAVQQLKALPIYTIKVMGCQAQSAASAAALAATAGVEPPSLPALTRPVQEALNAASPEDRRDQKMRLEVPPHLQGSRPTSLSSSPSARRPLLEGVDSTPLLTPTRDPGLTPDRQFGFRRTAMVPTERRKAGPQRLRARDRWNIEELRISDIMSKLPSEGAEFMEPGLEEDELAEMLMELYGEDTDLETLHWTFQLASRGKTRCTNTSDLYYAFRAHHSCHFLPQATMRTLATTNVNSKGAVNRDLLQQLLEELNDGYTVPAAEVNAVLDEAAALSNSGTGSGRACLLRAVSAWYLNVVRIDSPPARRAHSTCSPFDVFKFRPWSTTLKACYGRWMPEKGYHLEVLNRVRASIAEAEEAWHRERNSESGVVSAFWGLLQVTLLLVALVFPTGFFLWLVILGAEHGDDRCPKDLDGLITWFGVLGLANIVVGWADGAVSFHDDQVIKTSSIGLALKAVLLMMPWVGSFWTFHLESNDQQTCGLFLTSASSLLWTVLLISELVLGFAFLWHMAVFSEYEMTLRKGQQPDSQSGGPALRRPSPTARMAAATP
ncbi:unnamed protein product [Effrenium voratum]|nr:unnamed protein product [Effrenium voratum]